MKVITMESSAYKEMMAQIANIAGYIREARDEKKRKRETEDKLLDTAQAAKMLNVSKRTMQRMRTDHRIEYVVVRGSCRYRLSEILRLLEDNTVRNEEGTIDTLFHNHTLRTGGKPKGWMQKLMERLDRQDELLLAMKAEGKQPTITESIRLFDNQDLCMLLQISKRTLQRYRSVGALPYKTLGKKTYYSEEDVLTFLSNHIKDFKKEDIAFYKARIHNFFHK